MIKYRTDYLGDFKQSENLTLDIILILFFDIPEKFLLKISRKFQDVLKEISEIYRLNGIPD